MDVRYTIGLLLIFLINLISGHANAAEQALPEMEIVFEVSESRALDLDQEIVKQEDLFNRVSQSVVVEFELKPKALEAQRMPTHSELELPAKRELSSNRIR